MGIHDGHRENMRRRFRKAGMDAFADHEALEMLLFYAIPRRDTNQIAHALMNRFGSLDAVFAATAEEMQQVDGIGENAAVLLKLVPEIVKKARLAEHRRDIILDSAEKRGEYLLEKFRGERGEVVYQLCMDRKGKLLACPKLSEGGISSSEISIHRLVENAMKHSASTVVLAHNHPSGIALPSDADYAATDRAREALDLIGVLLLDHIIVADNDYVSMWESGVLRD